MTRAGDTGSVATSGVTVASTDLSDVGLDAVGRHGCGVRQHHLEGVAAEVVHLLGQCLNEAVELIERSHERRALGLGCLLMDQARQLLVA